MNHDWKKKSWSLEMRLVFIDVESRTMSRESNPVAAAI